MLARRFRTKTFEALKKKTGPVPGGVGYETSTMARSVPPSPAARRSTTRSSARISREGTSIRGST